MDQRNWLDLSRKLIDRFDFNDTETYIREAIGNNALFQQPYGIYPCLDYPSPFVTALSGAAMTGTVTGGIFFDQDGQHVLVNATEPFTLTSDPSNPRKAYLVARYAQEGSEEIPKPSNPTQNVFLNLLDSYEIEVLLGTPAGSPSYPALGATDIVLMGFTIPAAETIASNCTQDATVRNQGLNASTAIKTGTYSATPFDQFIPCNANGGAFTVTLPDFKFAEGATWEIQKTDSSANAVTIALAGATDTFRLYGSAPTSVQLTQQAESLTLRVKAGICYIL